LLFCRKTHNIAQRCSALPRPSYSFHSEFYNTQRRGPLFHSSPHESPPPGISRTLRGAPISFIPLPSLITLFFWFLFGVWAGSAGHLLQPIFCCCLHPFPPPRWGTGPVKLAFFPLLFHLSLFLFIPFYQQCQPPVSRPDLYGRLWVCPVIFPPFIIPSFDLNWNWLRPAPSIPIAVFFWPSLLSGVFHGPPGLAHGCPSLFIPLVLMGMSDEFPLFFPSVWTFMRAPILDGRLPV